ncbi:MAG TPA: DUF378 domain-containing protein [Bacillaceae bacterium]
MKTLRRIALALTVIGAINWGLIGLFQFDLVAAIFGGQESGMSRLIYTLVGLSGLIALSYLFQDDKATAGAQNQQQAGNNGGQNNQRNQTTYARPNYGTEFAEEPDLDKLYNPSKDAYENDNNKKSSE